VALVRFITADIPTVLYSDDRGIAVVNNGIIVFAFDKLDPWISYLLDRKCFLKKNRNSHG